MYHFPVGDTGCPIEYGLWSESNSVLGAMQGALELTHHLPTCLQDYKQKMTTKRIKDNYLFVVDNRLLHVPLANFNIVLCVTWTAAPKNRATLNLVLETKAQSSGFTLKHPLGKHFTMEGKLLLIIIK